MQDGEIGKQKHRPGSINTGKRVSQSHIALYKQVSQSAVHTNNMKNTRFKTYMLRQIKLILISSLKDINYLINQFLCTEICFFEIVSF